MSSSQHRVFTISNGEVDHEVVNRKEVTHVAEASYVQLVVQDYFAVCVEAAELSEVLEITTLLVAC